ncbi:MAG: response regulator [Actinobacteria bacterium]|nr:response regulator [Actinomycetota bacterium]MBU4240934.1 response regulator [Actinomycetota bacterium]MBU4386387.1 response regulator [Actinomycetota bacterium]MBU4489800.1 response regulator [Actinomycetota bacterium]MCG2794325.1 response regulator [Actinomycetes bacterium]
MRKSNKDKSIKIAVIDDDPSMVKVLRIMLATSGYEVVEALSGVKGVMIVKGESPDLVLLDIMMPDVDGFEVCRRLKLDPETKDIPVIFVSAKTGSEHIEMGLSMGAEGFLIKPFELQEILDKIEEVTGPGA